MCAVGHGLPDGIGIGAARTWLTLAWVDGVGLGVPVLAQALMPMASSAVPMAASPATVRLDQRMGVIVLRSHGRTGGDSLRR
ncbi:MAG TPA: hypothetical protein VMW80_03135 [Candidatus Dormibacteraeota bacterium]|nr:hypothetical protein [Candidatus Dormibacteraeota bacterium]